MKINIKNARRLETTLDEQIQRHRSKMIKGSGHYKTREDSISDTKEFLTTHLDNWDALQRIRTDIRDKIGLFNAEKGINNLTSQISVNVTYLDLLGELSNYKGVSEQHNYSTNKVNYSSGLDEETREQYYAESLKTQRIIQRLKDKCQGINASGTIELSTKDETFLKISGLMD